MTSVNALTSRLSPITLMKRLHRQTNAYAEETKRFMGEGGRISRDVEEEIEKLNLSYEVCAN